MLLALVAAVLFSYYANSTYYFYDVPTEPRFAPLASVLRKAWTRARKTTENWSFGHKGIFPDDQKSKH